MQQNNLPRWLLQHITTAENLCSSMNVHWKDIYFLYLQTFPLVLMCSKTFNTFLAQRCSVLWFVTEMYFHHDWPEHLSIVVKHQQHKEDAATCSCFQDWQETWAVRTCSWGKTPLSSSLFQWVFRLLDRSNVACILVLPQTTF